MITLTTLALVQLLHTGQSPLPGYDYVRTGNDPEVILAKNYAKHLVRCGPPVAETEAYLEAIDSGRCILHVKSNTASRLIVRTPAFILIVQLDADNFVTRLERIEEFPAPLQTVLSEQALHSIASCYARYGSSNAATLHLLSGNYDGPCYNFTAHLRLRWNPEVALGRATARGDVDISLHAGTGRLLYWQIPRKPTLSHYESSLATPRFSVEQLLNRALIAYQSKRPYAMAQVTSTINFMPVDFSLFGETWFDPQLEALAVQRKSKSFLLAVFDDTIAMKRQTVAIDAISGKFVAWREKDYAELRSGFFIQSQTVPGAGQFDRVFAAEIVDRRGLRIVATLSPSTKVYQPKTPRRVVLMKDSTAHLADWCSETRQLKVSNSNAVFDVKTERK